jgi:hypothetical protein
MPIIFAAMGLPLFIVITHYINLIFIANTSGLTRHLYYAIILSYYDIITVFLLSHVLSLKPEDVDV